MSFITPQEIYDATNGGLEVILSYYPAAQATVGKSNAKFKLRESEKTASANLKQVTGGVWVVTDFGGDGKPMNCIEIVRREENLSFYDAIQVLAERYNIVPPEQIKELLRPNIDKVPATDDETDGTWTFEVKEEFSDQELDLFFAEQVRKEVSRDKLIEICNRYHFYALASYSIIKNREKITFSSTEHYPIFQWVAKVNDKQMHKIYQPKSLDKGLRFMYYGGRPNDFVFGYAQARKYFEDMQPKIDDAEYEHMSSEEKQEARKEVKIPELILCTGGSDAMNVAAMGYQVVWLNSESASLAPDVFKKIKDITEKFCILYDLDTTGRRQAHELNMQYLELHQVRLPEWLSKRKDRRGNPCKDVRDLLRFSGSRELRKLVDTSVPYRFYDQIPQFSAKGKPTGYKYEANNVHLYKFLAGNGFYQMRIAGEVDIYIRIRGNIVEPVKTTDIKRFINSFLEERGMDVKLRNTFFNTSRMNAASFENLPFIELDFTDKGKDFRLMFFENAVWKITSTGITEYKPGELNTFAWSDEVIPHRVKKLPDFFKVNHDPEDDTFTIDLLNTDSIYFRFLINTAKVYWTIEEYGRHPNGPAVESRMLTPEQEQEQKQHLINRLFALGFILHGFRSDSRAWAVWAQEFKTVEEGHSDGGSGKSIFLKTPRFFQKTITLGARDHKLTENKHLLENVNEHTDYILLDDCSEYLPFAFFYPMITGGATINPKNTKSFELSFKEFPIMAFSSNFSPQNTDPSTNRRLLYTLFSDYYHHGPSDDHPESRTPKDDFGMELFTDFDENEWNLTINLAAQATRFAMATDAKVTPPMENAIKRSLLSEMGMPFKDWADVFFSEGGGNVDTAIPKDDAQKDCFDKVHNNKWTAIKFKKSLKAWCRFYHFDLNPKHLCNDKDKKRIINNVNGTSREMIFIQTRPVQQTAEGTQLLPDQLPF